MFDLLQFTDGMRKHNIRWLCTSQMWIHRAPRIWKFIFSSL